VKEAATEAPDEAPEITGVMRLLSELAVATLDLHHLTGAQAQAQVRNLLRSHTQISAGRVVHIITGKGARSHGAPVLHGLVRDMLDDEMAEHVDEYAGMMGGGGWVVRVR
jgi:DNA-nicking Smr family endonuclease